jgi:hypothetical protein
MTSAHTLEIVHICAGEIVATAAAALTGSDNGHAADVTAVVPMTYVHMPVEAEAFGGTVTAVDQADVYEAVSVKLAKSPETTKL